MVRIIGILTGQRVDILQDRHEDQPEARKRPVPKATPTCLQLQQRADTGAASDIGAAESSTLAGDVACRGLRIALQDGQALMAFPRRRVRLPSAIGDSVVRFQGSLPTSGFFAWLS